MVFLRPFLISFLDELRNLMILVSHDRNKEEYIPVAEIDRAIALLREQKFGWSSSDIPKLKDSLHPDLFDVIAKILETKTFPDLIKLSETSTNPKVRLFVRLSKIWGVGQKTALSMILDYGVTSFRDLGKKYELNDAQKLGLKYYDDMNSSMSRAEAERIIDILMSGPRKLKICGSYRRGKKKLNDLDVLVIGTKRPSEFRDFLYSAFVKVEVLNFRDKKLTALVKIPGRKTKMRQIDFRFIAQSNLPAAMIYFTGNAIFGRVIRQRAKRLGYKLNEYGIFKRTKRGAGMTQIKCKTEEEIFEVIGLVFIPPEKRSFTFKSKLEPFIAKKVKG